MLVIRLDLDDFSVERDRLREESFLPEVIGHAGVFRDRLVAQSGTEVEVSEGVDGIPVVRLIVQDFAILDDGLGELALADQLLRCAQRSFAIEWHGESGRSINRIKFQRQRRRTE